MFGGDGRDLLTGPLGRLAEPLADFFGPEVGAASLSLHVGKTGYVEIMALPRADTTAPKLAASLAANLDTMPERIERYCTALDPHPFGGATASFEALWMGIPVVTLTADRMVGRTSAMLLRHAGATELVAPTPAASAFHPGRNC